jgi:hypothetical protein
MTWRPQSLPPVPEATAAAVRAAFPRGNLSVDLRTEFGTPYDAQLLADLYALRGRPVEVAPWRCRSARMAVSSSMRSGGAGARCPCVTSPRWRFCVRFGSNTMTAVRS